MGLRIGDHAARVHLRARGRKGKHGDQRKRVVDGRGFIGKPVPGVAIGLGARADELGAIDGGAAAYGQHYVDIAFLAHLGAPAHRGDARIGLDAAQLDHRESLRLQQPHNAVIEAGALDGITSGLIPFTKRISSPICFTEKLGLV